MYLLGAQSLNVGEVPDLVPHKNTRVLAKSKAKENVQEGWINYSLQESLGPRDTVVNCASTEIQDYWDVWGPEYLTENTSSASSSST